MDIREGAVGGGGARGDALARAGAREEGRGDFGGKAEGAPSARGDRAATGRRGAAGDAGDDSGGGAGGRREPPGPVGGRPFGERQLAAFRLRAPPPAAAASAATAARPLLELRFGAAAKESSVAAALALRFMGDMASRSTLRLRGVLFEAASTAIFCVAFVGRERGKGEGGCVRG